MAIKSTARHNGLKHKSLEADYQLIKDALSQTAHDVKFKAEELVSQSIQDAKDKSESIKKKIDILVKNNPLKTIGYSALGGALIGFILRNTRK